jgi:Flp pilus assembly pilin Flp
MKSHPKDQPTNRLLSLRDDDSGQDMAEYAILIGLVALAVLVTVTVLGQSIAATFNSIGTSITP